MLSFFIIIAMPTNARKRTLAVGYWWRYAKTPTFFWCAFIQVLRYRCIGAIVLRFLDSQIPSWKNSSFWPR